MGKKLSKSAKSNSGNPGDDRPDGDTAREKTIAQASPGQQSWDIRERLIRLWADTAVVPPTTTETGVECRSTIPGSNHTLLTL